MTTISAEAIGNNIDLLTEILLRLQVKPLVRAKCVSKQWLSLISDPQFCVSHNRHHHTPDPTPTALLSKKFQIIPLKHDTILKVPSFDNLSALGFRILQSCNGLFLCLSNFYIQSSLYDKEMYALEEIYYICNPVTKQVKSLPFPSSKFKESLVSVCMAFNPLKSNHYKLICVCKVKNKKEHQINMFSSGTDSWSPLRITFTSVYRMDYAKPVYCNGIVHWYIVDKPKTSIYFDVDKECLKTMPMPNLAQRVIQYFGECQGRLHLIVTEDPSPLQFDILEMAADYSGWFVRYHVDLNAVRKAFPRIIWYHRDNQSFSVLQVIRAQKDEDSIVVIYVNNKAISYNVHDGTSKKLCDFEPYTRPPSWFDTYQYFGILTYV